MIWFMKLKKREFLQKIGNFNAPDAVARKIISVGLVKELLK
jgi:hypothetical protein